MGNNMNIRLNDRRERLYDRLERASPASTKAGALDAAARYYLDMAGGPADHQTGAVWELMAKATKQGSVTPEEIARVLDCDQLPVDYEQKIRWDVGSEKEIN